MQSSPNPHVHIGPDLQISVRTCRCGATIGPNVLSKKCVTIFGLILVIKVTN